jgi:hypothetical protein
LNKFIFMVCAGIVLLGLSGCNRDCYDCDDACDTVRRRADHSAITHCPECVPAPAPIAEVSPKVTPAPAEVKPIQPVPVQPERVQRVVQVSAPTPIQTSRPRKVRTCEIEIDDL